MRARNLEHMIVLFMLLFAPLAGVFADLYGAPAGNADTGVEDAIQIYEKERSPDPFGRLTSKNDEGLVARWNFDEGKGNTTADRSENGNDGTLANMGDGSWVEGRKRTGLAFDGVDDYVDCGNGSDLDIVDEITIEIWLKTYSILENGTSDVAPSE